jgi:hypothetical protein
MKLTLLRSLVIAALLIVVNSSVSAQGLIITGTVEADGLSIAGSINAGSITSVGGVTVGGNLAVTSNITMNGLTVVTVGTFIGFKVLTASGTYTPSAGTRSIMVELVGGGGAGGGVPQQNTAANGSGGGGGGSGAYTRAYFTGLNGTSTTCTYTIGAKGTGASAAIGGAGANTTFNANGAFTLPSSAVITANGGSGGPVGVTGTSVTVLGGAGGTAQTTSSTLFGRAGGNGGPGLFISTLCLSGSGGISHFGAGAPAVVRTATALSIVGTNAATGAWGAGGSGAVDFRGNAARVGGDGQQGVIIVWEYK